MSAEDSITQFLEFCESHDCETCEYLRFKDRGERYACAIAWMEKNAVSANNKIKLKPCPFCGGLNLLVSWTRSSMTMHKNGTYYSVKIACRDCWANAHGIDTWTEREAFLSAAEAWNRRAEA